MDSLSLFLPSFTNFIFYEFLRWNFSLHTKKWIIESYDKRGLIFGSILFLFWSATTYIFKGLQAYLESHKQKKLNANVNLFKYVQKYLLAFPWACRWTGSWYGRIDRYRNSLQCNPRTYRIFWFDSYTEAGWMEIVYDKRERWIKKKPKKKKDSLQCNHCTYRIV